jgi:hypothetical protein
VKADITKKIDAVVANGVSPALKAIGFKRKQRRFTKSFRDCTWIVEVQSGKFNYGSTGRFSVDIGVFHWQWYNQLQALPRLRHKEPLSDVPRIWHSQVREELGLLASHGSWWEIDENTNIEVMSLEVAQAITRFAAPWFEQMSSLPAAVSSIAEEYGHLSGAWIYKMYAMVGFAALGDITSASRMFKAADGDVIKSEEQEREFGAWARRLGVLPARA